MPDNLAGGEFADDWTLPDGLDIEIQEYGKIIDQGRVEVATKMKLSSGLCLMDSFPGAGLRKCRDDSSGSYPRKVRH